MRHPTEIPIEVWKVQEGSARKTKQVKDVSAGGLAFICSTDWHPGTPICVRLPLIKPPFEAKGQVVWCKKRQNYYEVGVAFTESNDAFTMRMIEQLCQIEMYRKRQESAGRNLDSEEAAMEWIERYAEEFSQNSSTFWQTNQADKIKHH